MFKKLFILMTVLHRYCDCVEKSKELNYNELDEHSLVTNGELFPYVAAVMKMSTYLSAGALIYDEWVLTAADALFLLRESSRTLRVRLGSINYKKGGTVLPVKYFEIHPSFDDKSPIFDIALIRLPHPVRFIPTLKPIRLQNNHKQPDNTHFIVTSWPMPYSYSDESESLKSMEIIQRRRILSVTHLHPSDPEDCAEELKDLDINDLQTTMCLDTGVMMDPCMRDAGAPVVLNAVLWGIVSSWRPVDCENDLAGPSFVSLVSAPNISSWIYATTRGQSWQKPQFHDYEWERIPEQYTCTKNEEFMKSQLWERYKRSKVFVE